MAKDPGYFMYFPGNYRWSAGFFNMLSSAPYGGAEIAVVKTDQRLSCAHIFIVADKDPGDEASHVRRYRRDIAPGIGVIGALDEAPDAPIVVSVPRPDEGDEPAKRRIGQPFEPRSGQHARWRCLSVFAGDGAHRCLLLFASVLSWRR